MWGKSHGQKSLAGYNPWGCKEADIAEHAGDTSEHYIIFGCTESFAAVCSLSLVVTIRGYALVVVHGLLIAVASLIVEPGLP